MRDYTKYVNVFQGNGKTKLPKPEGIAATWLFIKAQTGNTHPHAAYPYGKMSAGAYTGGYPTGYGNLMPSSCGESMEFDAHVRGFAHMHQTGTGAIGYYYNHALVSPVDRLGWMSDDIESEMGEPGYYAVRLKSGIFAELTVNERIARHRYRLPRPMTIQVDMANSGCSREFLPKFYAIPSEAEIRLVHPDTATARIVSKGVPLYFAVRVTGTEGGYLFDDYERVEDNSLVPSDLGKRYGAAFPVGETAEVEVAFSFVSCEAALAQLDMYDCGFDEMRESTRSVWQEHLSKIEIDEDEDTMEIFYSNLYHSMLKPSTAIDESFIGGYTYYDFSTIWDLYKTSLPLTLTLFEDKARGIVDSFLRAIAIRDRSPISMPISYGGDIAIQARMLMEHTFADYFFRYGDMAKEMLDATEKDLLGQDDFLATGLTERYPHTLDICEALAAMAEVARRVGDKRANEWQALASGWERVFDKNDGLLSMESRYYEGNRYNYSFRLLHEMDKRIMITGRREDFTAALDELFGYTREAVERPTVPELDPLSFGINSFQGFNNESDMEAPYAYIYSGEHQKCAEIVTSGIKYMFERGRGGIPGNNDSGALTSHYVFMMLGLYPVTGQDLVLISSPSVRWAKIHTATGGVFEIRVHGQEDGAIYVERVTLNGREITDYRISAAEMMQGGTLDVYKSKSF